MDSALAQLIALHSTFFFDFLRVGRQAGGRQRTPIGWKCGVRKVIPKISNANFPGPGKEICHYGVGKRDTDKNAKVYTKYNCAGPPRKTSGWGCANGRIDDKCVRALEYVVNGVNIYAFRQCMGEVCILEANLLE